MDRDLGATTTGAVGPTAPPGQEPSAPWNEWRPPPPPTSGRAVPLGELLTIAGLTPAQAVLVTADLLQATGATPPDRVHAVMRADGVVDVSAVDSAVPGVPLPELMDEIVRNARRLPAHPHPPQLRLLHHVEEQVGSTGDPGERATALREALGEVVGADAVTRVRRELAALMEAFNAIAVSKAGSGARVNGHPVSSPPVVRPESVRPPEHAPRQAGRRRARPRRLPLVLAVIAVALVAGGYVFLRGPGSDLIDDLRGGSNQASTQQPPPSHPAGHHQKAVHAHTQHGTAFPTLAAQSSGRVRNVELKKINSCAPGTACGVQVTVHLTPASVSQVVGWKVGVARGCARPVAWSAETTVTAQPGWTQVFASSSVQMPQGQPLVLVALTSTPNQAQSQPLPVAGGLLHC